MTWTLFQPLAIVMTMVPTLPWQFRRSLEIKKIITNPTSVNKSKKGWLLGHTPTVAEKLQKLHRKESNN